MSDAPSRKVNDRVRKEFKQDADQVLTLLLQYGSAHSESERVQLAILDLAQGEASGVSSLVDLALVDYRDVLNQAEYQNDPFNLLQALLADFQTSGLLTPAEVETTMRATGGTNYRNAFDRLLELVVSGGKTLTSSQYQSLDKLGRALKLPVKTWKMLAPK